ncbi:universal stress protein [Dehalococcoidia bacterium]|nr:universal stress protein [Dehalococcoidia bacterium]MCL0073699.1 universal stress protein [Dehalococcoidia bacterium]
MEFKRILVPVNGSKVDDDVIQLACQLARRSKGKVYVTYVIQLERTLSLDVEVKSEVDRGEEALDAAECCAENCDCEVITDLLQARAVGPALVNEAAERSIDLIVIGLGFKTRFGEFSLGDIVPYVLKNAPCRVILLREPVSLRAGSRR